MGDAAEPLIRWHDPKAALPDDGEECLLMPHRQPGLITTTVFGPMLWHAGARAWLDIFATAQAGEIIYPDQVGCWTLWDPIAPPDDLPTPFPKEANAEPERA